MEELAELLRRQAAAYRTRVHEEFYLTLLESRQIFALSMERTHLDLAPALAWYFERCDRFGHPSQEALDRMRFIGRDHRRHGFPPSAYQAFGDCLIRGLDLFDLSASDRIAAEYAIGYAIAALADAAREADSLQLTAAHEAYVVEVSRPHRQMAIVKLEAPRSIDYAPGQFFPVTSRLLPGTWLNLTPAVPANETRQLEFHIHNAGEAASMLCTARVNDVWTLGAPRGHFAPAEDGQGLRDVFVCFGTGWAAARAWLLARIERAVAADAPDDLECSVYCVAGSPGQHYDALVQQRLSQFSSELELHWLVDAGDDPWLLGAAPQPADFACEVTDDPLVTVLQREDATRCRFVLVGPAEHVDAAAQKLTAAGVEAARIEAHPWAHGRALDPGAGH